jgi:citrate lyase subunit beta/citryl-CoA lyase
MMRSWLFAPANRPQRMAKALAAGADVTVLDLEDACPDAEKEPARGMAREALQGPRRGLAYARINGLATGLAEPDLQALIGEGIDGVVLPKAEGAEQLEAVDRIIGLLETRRGLAQGEVDLVPLIETAAGLDQTRFIARACPRVRRFAFGAVDFAVDLGLTPGPDEAELRPYRAALVLAARLAGAEPPIDSAALAIDDEALIGAAAGRSKAMGFQGKLCVHPAQVAPVNAAFAASASAMAKAARIVEAFTAAEAVGSAAIQVDGELVDYPIYRRARQMLAAHLSVQQAGERTP